MKETYYDTGLFFFFFFSTAPSALLLPQFFKSAFSSLHLDTRVCLKHKYLGGTWFNSLPLFCCQNHHNDELLQLIWARGRWKILIRNLSLPTTPLQLPFFFNSINRLVNIKVSHSNTHDIYCTGSQKNNNNNNNNYIVMVRQIQSR